MDDQHQVFVIEEFAVYVLAKAATCDIVAGAFYIFGFLRPVAVCMIEVLAKLLGVQLSVADPEMQG